MARNLAQRAEQVREVAQQQPQTLGQQIARMAPEFQLAMPKGGEAGQLIRDAMTCLRTTRNLPVLDRKSVV